jgi:hypothetical protein
MKVHAFSACLDPALSRSKYVPSTLTFGTKPQTEAATEEDDCTGDSGVGTGSGSAKYGDVEDWKRGITKPPPVPEKPASRSHRRATTDVEDDTEKENFYTALREGTKERAHSYQGLKRGFPLS